MVQRLALRIELTLGVNSSVNECLSLRVGLLRPATCPGCTSVRNQAGSLRCFVFFFFFSSFQCTHFLWVLSFFVEFTGLYLR